MNLSGRRLGNQALIFKGLRFSYLEVSSKSLKISSPPLAFLLPLGVHGISASRVSGGGVFPGNTDEQHTQNGQKSVGGFGAVKCSVHLYFVLLWEILNREKALLKTPAASCQTVSPCSPSYHLSTIASNFQ